MGQSMTKEEVQKTLEQFAIAQAVEKKLKELTQTRDAWNLRGQADEILLEAYENIGSDRVELKVCGEKVGSLTVKMSKGFADIQDFDKFNKWSDDSGFTYFKYMLMPDLISEEDMQHLQADHPEWFEEVRCTKYKDIDEILEHMVEAPDGSVIYEPTGETLDFATWIPSQPMGTMVKGCDPDKVLDILNKHGIEASAVFGLLEGE